MNVTAPFKQPILTRTAGRVPSLPVFTFASVTKAWSWLAALPRVGGLQGKKRRLQVKETISLGEKRFVSILEVDGQSLLIGGGAETICLLATMQADSGQASFQQVFEGAMQGSEAR